MDGLKSVAEMSAGQGVETNIPPKPSDLKEKRRVFEVASSFGSVKDVVSRFGGTTTDWKANRTRSMERINFAEKSEENQLQNEELENTMKLIDEMKLGLEKAQQEEDQAKQDAELMMLKVQEMEQNIQNEACIAAKAQLEAEKTKLASAVSDLKAIEEELKSVNKDHASMVTESKKAIKDAEEAVAESKKAEKAVKDLSLELNATKEALESAKTKNLEIEKARARAAIVGDLKSKLFASYSLLLDLKGKSEETTTLKKHSDEEQRNELEQLKCKIEKATAEVNSLKETSQSLKSELEEEKSVNAMIEQSEKTASDTVASLKDELETTQSMVQQKEKEAKEKMIELSKKLEEASQEADQAKVLAQEAQSRLHEAKEEAEQAKAKADEMASRVLAEQNVLEAVKASEKSAMASCKALQENESARSNGSVESPSEVTLSEEQYDRLCKLAHEANEQANKRISAANSQIDVAKDSEVKTLMRLDELNDELTERRKLLTEANEISAKAEEGKLGVEQELRDQKALLEKQRNASGETRGMVIQNKNSKSGAERLREFIVKLRTLPSKKGTGVSSETKPKKKSLKSLYLKISLLFARKKTHPTKSA